MKRQPLMQLKERFGPLMRGLAGSLAKAPDTIRREDWCIYVVVNCGSLAGLLVHASFVALFLLLGIRFLAWFNVFSVCLYSGLLWLNHKKFHYTAFSLASVEMVSHAVACQFLIGKEPGFQYWLVTGAAFVFLFPSGYRFRKFGLFCFFVGPLITLHFLAPRFPPLHPLSPLFSEVLGSWNLGTVCVVLAAFALSFRLTMEKLDGQLAEEHEKTDRLLRNILPDQVADRRLRDGTSVIADGYNDVSVLFCGIVGLAPLSEKMTPGDMVALLNDVFTRCDQLAEKHGVERIKTIGGIYVAAAGAPVPRNDHAICLARFALELRDTMHAWFQETGQGLSVRIGMCSGPVIGGIIGTRRFIYDLWGETVSVASGMETHGLIGEIQVADPSYRLLRALCRFEPRGRIRITGKEPVDAYLLKGFMAGDPARLTGQIHHAPLADGREAQTR